MNREMRKRYVIRTWAEIAAIGGIYLLVILLTPLRIPCPIRFLTGFQCPGCGVTRMVLDLLKLDVRQAFRDNAFVLLLLPVLVPWGIYRTKKYIEEDSPGYSIFELILLGILLAGAVLFGIIRNI